MKYQTIGDLPISTQYLIRAGLIELELMLYEFNHKENRELTLDDIPF